MNTKDYSELGGKYFSEKNFDGAIAAFSDVIKLEPDNPFAYYKRGLSYTNKKEFDLAITDFTEAIRLEPNKFGEFYFDRAGACISKGDCASAISDLEMAIKIDPKKESYRETLEELKAGKTSESKSGQKPSRRKGHFIVIIIFAVIGLVIGLIAGGIVAGLVSIAIGAIFGIGIIPWLAHMKSTLGVQLEANRDYGFSLMTVITFLAYMLLSLIWASIKSPFVGIYQLITGNYD